MRIVTPRAHAPSIRMPPIPAGGAFRTPIWCIPTLGLIPIRGSIPLWHSVVVNPTPVGLGSAAKGNAISCRGAVSDASLVDQISLGPVV